MFGCHCRFVAFVDVGDCRDVEFRAYPAQDSECFFVAYACERVKPRAVGFTVAAFECERYSQSPAYAVDFAGYVEGHLFAFDHAWSGEQEESVAGL